MPENPRLVLELRDMKGLFAENVCNLLGISASNARVLLCRARTRQANTEMPTRRAAGWPRGYHWKVED